LQTQPKAELLQAVSSCKESFHAFGCRLNRIAGLVRKEQSGGCSGLRSAPSPGKALRGGVMVVMVVVVMVVCRKCGRAGEHHQKQNYRENPLHGSHPSRIEFATEAPCRISYQESNEGRQEDEASAVRAF
jgi:hypothetical protein